MDKRNLFWIIPLCLFIGWAVTYLSFDRKFVKDSLLQKYMDGKLSALESQIKHNDSLQVLLMDSIMTTRIAESVINIKESQINTSKTKEINDILTATPMQIDTMYESAYYRAMQRYRSGTLYIQR